MNEPRMVDKDIAIPIGAKRSLPGRCTVPADARELVVFVHGSGSSRHSPRNRTVAGYLNELGLGTVLFDLLTQDEEGRRTNVFDIDLLVDRVGNARSWIAEQDELTGLSLGLFGASTGAAAALVSAGTIPAGVAAVVSRGGRVDMAGRMLPKVAAPTLFIVGALDTAVLEWNEQAARLLTCEHRVDVVPGASHLFEEPGTLDVVAESASRWFIDHFPTHPRRGFDQPSAWSPPS
ncbi:MAG: dienelactone hydrolase family protein [Candidatus Nanopelagicales bacterium]